MTSSRCRGVSRLHVLLIVAVAAALLAGIMQWISRPDPPRMVDNPARTRSVRCPQCEQYAVLKDFQPQQGRPEMVACPRCGKTVHIGLLQQQRADAPGDTSP